jgi:hypothetical protein
MFLDLMKQRGWECDWQFDWFGKHLSSTSGANNTTVSNLPRGAGGVGGDPQVTSPKEQLQQTHVGDNMGGGGGGNKNVINNRDKVIFCLARCIAANHLINYSHTLLNATPLLISSLFSFSSHFKSLRFRFSDYFCFVLFSMIYRINYVASFLYYVPYRLFF